MHSNAFRGDKKYRILFFAICGVILFVVLALLFGLLVKFLWNQTITDIFGLNAISFWQAVGLLILAKLFFGLGMGSSQQLSRRDRRRKSREDERKGASGDDSVSGLADDEVFRKFWEEEGKQAYESYRQDREDESN